MNKEKKVYITSNTFFAFVNIVGSYVTKKSFSRLAADVVHMIWILYSQNKNFIWN